MVVALFFSGIVISQGQERINLIKLSPQHFIVSTLKIDWEFSTDQKKGSWVISPSITARDQYKDTLSYGDEVLGFGMAVSRKVYVAGQSSQPLSGFYGMVSASYNFYKTKYNTYNSYSTGPPNYYYYSGAYESKQDIHSGALSFSMGYQFTIKQLLYLDLFLGGGVRYSHTSTDDDYYSSFADFAYNGIEPKAGVTFGLKL